MKKLLSVILVLVMLVSVCSVSVFAEGTELSGVPCGDNAFWSYDEETRTVTVSGTGEMWDNAKSVSSAGFDAIIGELEYRAEKIVIEEGITTVGENTFAFCTAVKEIDLPSTLQEIKEYAFYCCINLKEIRFSEGLETIGSYAFYGALILEKLTLPSTVSEIGKCAFADCFNLKELTLNEGLETIGDLAFYHPYSLTEFVIPSTVTEFDFLNNIAEGPYPMSVVNLSDTYVPFEFEEGFDGNFENFEMPDYTMFCYMFTRYAVYGAQEYGGFAETGEYDEEKVWQMAVADVNEKFGTDFADDHEVENAIGTITDFNDFLRISCPEYSVQHEYLKKAGIPHTLTDSAFDYACGIYNTGGQCGDNAFWSYDEETRTVTVSGTGEMWDNAKSVSSADFDAIIGELEYRAEKIVIEEGITTVGENTFALCTAVKEIELPSTVKEIKAYAFCECFNLKEIRFSEGLEKIGDFAFYSEFVLEGLTLPSTVTEIGEAAFAHCFNLKKLTLNEGLKKIGEIAFCHPYSLTEFVIPSTVTEFDFLNNIAEGPFPMSVVNLSDTLIPFEFEEDFYGNFENGGMSDFTMFCYMYTRYGVYLAQAYAEYAETYVLDDEKAWQKALDDVNEKFGTDFADNSEIENAIGTLTDFNDYLRIYCPENSAQHEYLKEAGIPHILTDSSFDCACGVHNVYENDYIAPNCTENGYKGGKVCLECEKIFEVPELVPAVGHSPVTVPAEAPGCCTPGRTEGVVCETCGQLLSGSEPLSPLGHKDADGDGLCDVCGEETDAPEITFYDRIINYVRGIVNSILALFKKLFAFLG